MGAVGPRHFLQIVNGRAAVFDKRSGLRLSHVHSSSFFHVVPGPKFDPRVFFDAQTGRWVASAAVAMTQTDPWGIVLAVSRTDDPFGEWFQVFFYDPELKHILHDFPMLGVGPESICIGACICDIGGKRALWAFEKAPLLANPPRLGAITQWSFASDHLIPLPVQSYGRAGEDVVLGVSPLGGSLGVYFLDGPPNAPTLRYQGSVAVPMAELFAGPPPAPGLPAGAGVGPGLFVSSAPLYRNRTIWIVLRGESDGRNAFHWRRINPFTFPPQVVQSGLVSHPTLNLFMPSLAVNEINDVLFGFSASNEQTYVGAYYAGRRDGDPPGSTGAVQVLKAGEAIYGMVADNRRWGDYTATCVDPEDDRTLWTVQQYAAASAHGETWGTWVGSLSFTPFDCNHNGISDACDIDCKVSGCLPPCGRSFDCQLNGVPDECEPDADCDANAVRDHCELALGAAANCNDNALPDACELDPDCDQNAVPDECDPDCNENGVPDACDLEDGPSEDCNTNGMPDECEAVPNSLLHADPAFGSTFCRLQNNVLRLAFQCDLDGLPIPGQHFVVAERLPDGYFGPDLSASLTRTLESPKVVALADPHGELVPGKWYWVVNVGWPALAYFSMLHAVQVGDIDGNVMVDIRDHALLVDCLTAPEVPSNQGSCERADLDGDRDIDLTDFAVLQVWIAASLP
jgi:hypothetical protein